MKDRTKKIFRIGFATKGVLYFLIGFLFISASQSTGKTGVLQFILEQPYGKILLALTGIGLLGYSAFRWYEALTDPEQIGQSEDAKKTGKRVGFAVSGMAYALLAITAFSMLIGSGGNNGGNKKAIAAELMSQPFGQWLVGILGAILIGVGIRHLYRAISEKYKQKIRSAGLSEKVRKIYGTAAKAGLSARGVVFGLIGFFMIQAAIQHQPSEAGGLNQVFEFLQGSGFPWAAVLMAVGLAAYGVYMFVQARHRPL